VASQARIAKAKADQEATERELAAQSMKAQFERDMAIKRAGFLAETEEAKARAGQAGPLAEAQASQQVIEMQTALAQRQAELAAHAERATAQGQADANKARADSLREGNQELIAASRLVEILPTLVEAAARGLTDSNLTILNGTQASRDRHRAGRPGYVDTRHAEEVHRGHRQRRVPASRLPRSEKGLPRGGLTVAGRGRLAGSARLTSSRCDVTPAPWWSWPDRRPPRSSPPSAGP
jgi:hypothetical protein